MSPRFRCAESAQNRSEHPARTVPAMTTTTHAPTPDIDADVLILGIGPRSPWVSSGRINKANATAAVKRFRETGGSVRDGTVTVATVMPVDGGFNIAHWTV